MALALAICHWVLSSKFLTCVMFYSGNGKPVAPYDSSSVETLIIYVVRVKSKNEYNLDIILYPFLELQYSYPSWAQTSEYGTIQRSIAVYGQYKHGPYLFMGSPQSPLTLRGLCSAWDLSVAVHVVLSVTVTLVKMTLTRILLPRTSLLQSISTVQKCSFRSVRRWLWEYNCLLWVVWASWKLAWLSEANKMTLKREILKSTNPFHLIPKQKEFFFRFALKVAPDSQQ